MGKTKLHYGRVANFKDDPIRTDEPYVFTGKGDSGSAYWIEDTQGSDRRQTVIALVCRGYKRTESMRLWGKLVPCMKWASILTNDVTKWTKFIDTEIDL